MSTAFIAALTGNIATFSCGNFISWSSFEVGKLSDINETTLDTPLTKEEGAWVASLVNMGAIFGPFLFGYLTTLIGRKYTILMTGPPLLLSALLLAFSTTVGLIYFARILSGIVFGGLVSVFPNYIAEISESHNRGALNSIMNISIGAGLLFSYAVGPFLGIRLFNIILAIFPVLFLILFFFTGVESPYYYVHKHKHDLAKSALQKIRGPDTNIEDELMLIQLKIKEAGKGSFLDLFKSRSLIKAFLISVGLLAVQQLCGMNAVLFYSENIFEDANVSLEPRICAIIVGFVLFVSNFLIPLTVDRLGRKMVLLLSAGGMALSEVIFGVYYYLKDNDTDVSSIDFLPVACLVIFVIFYALGFASTPWIYLGEIFPSNIKSVAIPVASTIGWILGSVFTKYFSAMVDALGMGTCFWIFAAICGISIPFIQFWVLETKGKTLHEIHDILGTE